MRAISDLEAKGQLTDLLDTVDSEPVVIRRGQQDVAVLLSVSQYDRIMGRNTQALQQFCDEVGERAKARGMNQEVLDSVLSDVS
jgi:prevent-host-death family protein